MEFLFTVLPTHPHNQAQKWAEEHVMMENIMDIKHVPWLLVMRYEDERERERESRSHSTIPNRL